VPLENTKLFTELVPVLLAVSVELNVTNEDAPAANSIKSVPNVPVPLFVALTGPVKVIVELWPVAKLIYPLVPVA